MLAHESSRRGSLASNVIEGPDRKRPEWRRLCADHVGRQQADVISLKLGLELA